MLVIIQTLALVFTESFKIQIEDFFCKDNDKIITAKDVFI